jgi:hypothetical protein
MQRNFAARLDIGASGLKQFIDIILRDAVAAQFNFNGRQHAIEPARRHADPSAVNVQPSYAFGLLHRVPDRQFGLFDIRNAATGYTATFALTSAQHQQIAIFGLPCD